MHDIGTLVLLDKRIDDADRDSLTLRWEFGRELLSQRVGKKLPTGLLDELCEQTSKSRPELQKRMQFAELYDGTALHNALRNGTSWFQLTQGFPAERERVNPRPREEVEPEEIPAYDERPIFDEREELHDTPEPMARKTAIEMLSDNVSLVQKLEKFRETCYLVRELAKGVAELGPFGDSAYVKTMGDARSALTDAQIAVMECTVTVDK